MMVNCQLQLGSGRGIEYRSQNPEFKKMELMPMLNNRVTLGHINESLAVGYLKKQGYKIIETNFKTKIGEIYIIAMDKKTLVFVDVKSRNPGRFGSPKNLVTYKKQKKNFTGGAFIFKNNPTDEYQCQIRRCGYNDKT